MHKRNSRLFHVRNVNKNLLTRFKETRYDKKTTRNERYKKLEGSFQSASLS